MRPNKQIDFCHLLTRRPNKQIDFFHLAEKAS